MKLSLDPEQLRTSMQLWRDAVDLKLQLAPAIRSHMMLMRRQIMGNYVMTARHWLDLLRVCKAEPGSETELDDLRVEVEDFRIWAEGEIRAIAELSQE